MKLKHIFLYLVISILLYSCKAIKYIPIETTKSDTTYITKIRVDSIYQRDSIYIEHKQDTITKVIYKYIYKYINNTDTLWHTRVDTIMKPYPVQKELTKWQKAKITLSECCIIICFILLIIYIMRKKLWRIGQH